MGNVEPLLSQPPVPQLLTIETTIDIAPISTLGVLLEIIEDSGQISFPLGEKEAKMTDLSSL